MKALVIYNPSETLVQKVEAEAKKQHIKIAALSEEDLLDWGLARAIVQGETGKKVSKNKVMQYLKDDSGI